MDVRWQHPELAAFAALALPLVALFVARRKPVELESAYRWLWEEVAGARQARRYQDWLRLLWQLLVIAVGVAALAGPYRGEREGPRQLRITVDRSLSMGARLADGRTRLAAALARLEPELLPGCLVTVVALPEPEVVVERADAAGARRALASLRPSQLTATPASLALLARAGQADRRLLVSDGAGLAQPPEGVQLVAPDEAAEHPHNLALAGLRLWPAELQRGWRLTVDAQNFGPRERQVRLRATDAEGRRIAERSRSLPAGSGGAMGLTLPPSFAGGAAGRLLLELTAIDEGAPDPLDADHIVPLWLPELPRASVTLVAPGGREQLSPYWWAIMRALAGDGWADPDRVVVATEVPRELPGAHRVLVLDGVRTRRALPACELVISFGSRAPGIANQTAVEGPQKVWRQTRDHPLLANVDLGQLRVHRGGVLAARREMTLVESARGPLLLHASRGGVQLLQTSYRLGDSNLGLLPHAFAPLLKNTLRAVLTPPAAAAPRRVGDALPDGRWQLTPIHGAARLASGRARRAGWYEQESRALSAHVEARAESDLRRPALPAPAPPPPLAPARVSYRLPLIALTAALWLLGLLLPPLWARG